MNNWKRVLLVLILFGSVAIFGYWSTNQFNQALNDLNVANDSSVANAYSFYLSRQKVELDTTDKDTEADDDKDTEADTETDTDKDTEADTETAETDADTIFDDSEFSFVSPQEGDEVYIGCTYSISWQASTTVDSLGVNLIDASTKEAMGPIASGLAKENTVEKDSQNLNWKVGGVWPGSYYIKASNVNGAKAELRSKVFEINKMSENISSSEKESICKGTGGSFSV